MKLEKAIQSDKFRDEVHKASLNILYTAWWLKTLLSRELKMFGLTHEQYNVLRILRGKYPDPLCVRDIASRMIEKSSNVPRIVDRLVVKKLVKRSASEIDRRETVITLTQTGKELLAASTARVDAAIADKVTMGPEDARLLNRLLEKLRSEE